MDAQPSVVDMAPFVNATGVPEANEIPAVFPKYQLLNLPDWAKLLLIHKPQNSRNRMNRKEPLRLFRRSFCTMFPCCFITWVYVVTQGIVELIYDSLPGNITRVRMLSEVQTHPPGGEILDAF